MSRLTVDIFLDAFEESKHPRNHGKFASKGNSSSGSTPSATPWHQATPKQVFAKYYNQVIAPKLTDAEKKAVKLYHSGSASDVNIAARWVSARAPEQAGPLAGVVKLLDAAMRKNRIPIPLTLYRGIDASFEQITGYKDPQAAIGKAFVHGSFVSASASRSVSEEFGGGVLLKFDTPANTPGLVAPPQKVMYELEQEVVLPRESRFRIEAVEPYEYDYKTKALLLHCKYLGSSHAQDRAACDCGCKD